MGIDIESKLIVGAFGEDLTPPEDKDLYDWLVEDHDMDCAWTYYDAPEDHVVFGYDMANGEEIVIDDLTKFTDDVIKNAAKFEEITGVKAFLLCVPDVS